MRYGDDAMAGTHEGNRGQPHADQIREPRAGREEHHHEHQEQQSDRRAEVGLAMHSSTSNAASQRCGEADAERLHLLALLGSEYAR